MAVVSIPHCEPWIVARWVFSELMRRLAEDADTPEDRETALAAEALDGLHFHLLDDNQRGRLARRLSLVADHYRFEVSADDPKDQRGLSEALATLEMRLHDLFDESAIESDQGNDSWKGCDGS